VLAANYMVNSWFLSKQVPQIEIDVKTFILLLKKKKKNLEF